LSKSSISAYGNRTVAENNKNFKVMVRVRPPLPRELEATHFLPTVLIYFSRSFLSKNSLDKSQP